MVPDGEVWSELGGCQVELAPDKLIARRNGQQYRKGAPQEENGRCHPEAAGRTTAVAPLSVARRGAMPEGARRGADPADARRSYTAWQPLWAQAGPRPPRSVGPWQRVQSIPGWLWRTPLRIVWWSLLLWQS